MYISNICHKIERFAGYIISRRPGKQCGRPPGRRIHSGALWIPQSVLIYLNDGGRGIDRQCRGVSRLSWESRGEVEELFRDIILI